MIINALNSGAKVFMADCEDSLSPTWDNVVGGQINLRDAVRRTIELVERAGQGLPAQQPDRRADGAPARLASVREAHHARTAQPVPGAFVDFGLYLFHNAKARSRAAPARTSTCRSSRAIARRGCGPTCSTFRSSASALPHGTIKVHRADRDDPRRVRDGRDPATSCKDYIVGLNCGRWDYIFSFIKKFAQRVRTSCCRIAQVVTMTTHFLRSYSLLCIKTCHRRGAFAMGGMAAQIPIKNDPEANEAALGKVRADKEREATDGHDGTWVAHPGLVPIAREIFDRLMQSPNQLHKQRKDVNVTATDLLAIPRRQDHRRRPAQQRERRPAVHRRLARRQRLRADQQPDGRRGDRRDLARADLAMDSPPGRRAE